MKTVSTILETEETIKAQVQYCKENELPVLAPYRCDNCDNVVYDGYEFKECKKELITRCAFCSKSFAE